MRGRTAHFCLVTLFILASLADLYLTSRLLGQSGGHIYEGNPLARWCLNSFGMGGLVLYKLGAIVFVVAMAATISQLRPLTGRRFLTFACTVVTAVVVYSGGLLYHSHDNSNDPKNEQVIAEKGRRLDEKLQKLHLTMAFKDHSN